MNTKNYRSLLRYAWQHKHVVYSYLLLRLAMISPFSGFNAFIHRLRGVHVGKGVKIFHDVIIDPIEPGSIILEDYTILSPRVVIFAHAHRVEQGVSPEYPLHADHPLYEYVGPRIVKPVIIKEASWVGIGAIILPGVTIGKYCLIGAGAVVTKDVPDFTVAMGIPAKPVRTVEKIYKKKEL